MESFSEKSGKSCLTEFSRVWAYTPCSDFIQVPARLERYAQVSSSIMRALERITPEIEIFSVDEAFLDVTHVQSLWGPPEAIGRRVKHIVYETAGICCSVGVSGDKTTAKYGAKRDKPDGLTVIRPWEAEAALKEVPVTELCGISSGIGYFLAQRGVHRCGDMRKLPISALGKRFGNPGRRIWLMCQGQDPDGLHREVPPPKSVGHGKVMPPDTRDREILNTYLLHMAEKVAARLRRHHFEAKTFFVGLRTKGGWTAAKYRCAYATDDARHIMQLAYRLLNEQWRGKGVYQVQITALDPKQTGAQQDMFEQRSEKQFLLNRIRDEVNQRYGEFTLAPAVLLNRSDMPNVIAPAWKPFGHRETILR